MRQKVDYIIMKRFSSGDDEYYLFQLNIKAFITDIAHAKSFNTYNEAYSALYDIDPDYNKYCPDYVVKKRVITYQLEDDD